MANADQDTQWYKNTQETQEEAPPHSATNGPSPQGGYPAHTGSDHGNTTKPSFTQNIVSLGKI